MPRTGPRRGNNEGSIYKRFDKAGKLIGYCAQYTDHTGKKRYLYAKKKTEAHEKLKAALRNNDDGIVVESGNLKFADWMKDWLEIYVRPRVKDSTYYRYHSDVYNHIAPAFPKISLRDVRTETLQRYLNGMLDARNDGKQGGYSTQEVKFKRDRINSALRKAVSLGYIARNPCEGVEIQPVSHKEKNVFSKQEQKTIEAAIKDHIPRNYIYGIFLLMLYTGLRYGEAAALMVNDIDFEKKEINIKRSIKRVCIPKDKRGESGEASILVVGNPKTKTSIRTIPMTTQVEELLSMAIEIRNEREGLTGTTWYQEGYIFLTANGNPAEQNNLYDRMCRMERKHDLPHVGLHGLRHTFATRWIEAGLDIKTLSEILGHSNASITMNVYAHSLPEQKRDSMNRLSEAFLNL